METSQTESRSANISPVNPSNGTSIMSIQNWYVHSHVVTQACLSITSVCIQCIYVHCNVYIISILSWKVLHMYQLRHVFSIKDKYGSYFMYPLNSVYIHHIYNQYINQYILYTILTYY